MANDQLTTILFTSNVFVDFIGVFFFVPLIIVTIKHKPLHTTCHLLIGIYAFCCLCSKTIIILPYIVFMFMGTIPFYQCFFGTGWNLLPHLNIQPLLLVIGLDRVLSILFPMWYNNRGENKLYLFLVYTGSSLFPLYLGSLMVRNMMANFSAPMHCDFVELVGKDGTEVFTLCSMIFNCATICCYIIIIAKLAWMTRKGKASEIRFSLYKSLTLIMVIQTCGWMGANAGYAFIRMLSVLDDDQKAVANCCVNYLSSLSTTLEVPVIYFSSTEHRNGFKAVFGTIFPRIASSNTKVIQVAAASRNILISTIVPHPTEQRGDHNTM